MADKEDMIKKFVDMTKDFKLKADGLMGEITTAFNTNLGSAVKNYTEMQGTYANGFTGIANGAIKANVQLLESMDKNYLDLKTQITSVYTDTQTKAAEAIDSGSKDFQTQCEDMVKKFPMLPESAYKETLKSITDSKGRVNGMLEKQFKEVVGKLDKNYQQTRKELTLPDLKTPKLPGMDAPPGLVDQAKSAMSAAATTVGPMVKNLTDKLPGTSKNAK